MYEQQRYPPGAYPYGYGYQPHHAFHPYHRVPSPPSPPAPPAPQRPLQPRPQAQHALQHPAMSPPLQAQPQPHHAEQPPVQIKGKRKRASPQQLEVLNKVFASTSFPSTEMRNRLARELGMTPRTVQIWFQNKRQASRQRDGHHSRNTKSMAASAANINSFGRQYSKSQSPPAAAAAAAAYAPPAVAAASPGSQQPPQLQQQQQQQQPQQWCGRGSAAASPRANANASPGIADSGYAHTRKDRWFTSNTPSRLEYLFSHNSRVVLVSQHSRPTDGHLGGAAPKCAPGPALHTPDSCWPVPAAHIRPPLPGCHAQEPPALCVAPARRTLSLMDLLNAPPEQRKLPPLPPVAP
ncbi:Short stature homeobox protein 2 [Coemansia javaensis]|uniref:Short stature homeobox protein 2 n=1 Tax=Coemansia javaensis TaxID=2761396 RepID=A0A9W8LJP0_9FUNG|nr:Short stature homeobox protein 2 [Coemansia javaensis]